MPADTEFVAHCRELLAPLGAVRSRRMFGGHGFYVDDLFVALIAFERLYLKADTIAQPDFAAAGSQPFAYPGRDGQVVVSAYWSAPGEAMDSPALMHPWLRLAIASALRAHAAKASAPVRKARAATPAKAARSPRKPRGAKAGRG